MKRAKAAITGRATLIEETSTITAKGQTTVPKAVRQTLGIDYGGKIAYRIKNGHVTVHNAEAEHADPALAAFLELLARDIAQGCGLRDLPAGLRSALRRVRDQAGPIDLNEPLSGAVAL